MQAQPALLVYCVSLTLSSGAIRTPPWLFGSPAPVLIGARASRPPELILPPTKGNASPGALWKTLDHGGIRLLLAQTRDELELCVEQLARDPYTNYTIIGNIATFRNPGLLQPNPLTVFVDDTANPGSICTVEDGRFSSEVVLACTGPDGDGGMYGTGAAGRRLVEEAVDFSYGLRAGMLQAVVQQPEYLALFERAFGPLHRHERYCVMALARDVFKPPDGPRSQIIDEGFGDRHSGGGLGVRRGFIEGGMIISTGRAESRAAGTVEIFDVRTLPEYRGRGLARRVVADLCREILDWGHVPVYVVNEENSASLRVALALGFEHKSVFSVYRAAKRERKAQETVEC